MTSRLNFETMAREVIELRPRVAALEQANRDLETKLGRATADSITATPPPPDLASLSDDELQAVANEVFDLRRRLVELEAENRTLKMEVTTAAPTEPPVPTTPETGFAFGIADATGRRAIVVAGEIVKIGKDPKSHVVLAGARPMHAVIERTANGVSIIDLGTKEGTLVNGTRITKTMLESGDRLGIADAQLIVVFGTK